MKHEGSNFLPQPIVESRDAQYRSTPLEAWQLSTGLLFKKFKPPTCFDYHLVSLKCKVQYNFIADISGSTIRPRNHH